jgi:hypothetical protein
MSSATAVSTADRRQQQFASTVAMLPEGPVVATVALAACDDAGRLVMVAWEVSP